MKRKIKGEDLLAAIDLLEKADKDVKHESFFVIPCKKHALFFDPNIEHPDTCVMCLEE